MIAASSAARDLAVLVVVMALLNLVDAATPTLLGRDLNLYWDLPHLPSLFGLAAEAAGFWQMAVAIAVLAGAIFLLIAGTMWTWRQVLPALADRRIALGFAVLLGRGTGRNGFNAGGRAAARDRAWARHRSPVGGARAGTGCRDKGWRTLCGGARSAAAAAAATSPDSSDATSISFISNPTAPRSSIRRSSATGSATSLTSTRGVAARGRLHHRLEPAGLPDLWGRLLARPCDARKWDPARRSGAPLFAARFRPQALARLL